MNAATMKTKPARVQMRAPRRRLTLDLEPAMYTRLRTYAAQRTEHMGHLVPLRDIVAEALELRLPRAATRA
jgi:hypothetical protein